jgi:hypothetical protein
VKRAVAVLAALTVAAGGTATTAAASARTSLDVRSLATAESVVLTLLDRYQDTPSWRSAFNAAVSTQNADLARMKSDLPGRGTTTLAGLVAVPNLINVELDHAEAELQSDGLTYTTVGGGIFGIVVTADWTVCAQHPGPGSRVAKGSSVELDVEKFHCS